MDFDGQKDELGLFLLYTLELLAACLGGMLLSDDRSNSIAHIPGLER